MSSSTASGTTGSQQYGFIGIGVMGWPMAINVAKSLTKAGTLTICDIDAEKVDEFVRSAAQVSQGTVQSARTPKDICDIADIIITSLPHAKHVKQVFCDPETGLLAASKRDSPRLFLETSTIEVSGAAEVAERVRESGMGEILDCPISGGPKVAEQATLAIIVGGDRGVYEKALPFLRLMGRREKIYFCGPPGAGLAAKQANNYAAFIAYIGLCEAMNIGVRYGLDPKVLGQIINDSSGMSWNSVNQNPVKGVIANSSASRDFEGGALTELCDGVISSTLGLARHVKAKMVTEPLVRGIFKQALEDPRTRGKEYRSIYRLISEEDRDTEE